MTGSPDPLAVAQAVLAPDERLIWADRPRRTSVDRRGLGMVGFGLLLALVALLWTGQAWAEGRTVAWVGLPFAALGLGFATRPWWRRPRADVVYAVSDRRLMIIRGPLKPRVRSYGPADLQDLEVQEAPDGSGDLIFRREIVLFPHPVDEKSHRHALPRRHRIGFFGISEVRRVAATVRRLQEESRQAAGR